MSKKKENPETGKIIIKKYPNRRLYRTDTSKYITLDDLRLMVKEGKDFVVQDAKSGLDLTQSTLVQVIFEQELNGMNILPINFLRRLIGFYDDSLRPMLPPYLEASMEAFHQNQQKMREMMKGQLTQLFPMQQFEEAQKRNMEFLQGYMDMFKQFNPMTTYFKKDEEK